MNFVKSVRKQYGNPDSHAFFLGFNGFEIYYSGVLGVANYESELRL